MARTDHVMLMPIALVVASAPASIAHAAVYLTTEAAQRALFPQAQSLEEVPITLTDAQRAEVAECCGTSGTAWRPARVGRCGGGRRNCWGTYSSTRLSVGRTSSLTRLASTQAASSSP